MSKKAKIEALRQEVERRGGAFWFSDAMPEELADAMLEEILDCPLCTEMELRRLTPSGDH